MNDEGLPLVSVIITAYGRADFLNQAIESVKNQTYSNYELIIVDDNSPMEVVNEYKIPDSAVFIRHETNRGFAAATRNTGIRIAKGKYLAFLDFDDIWFPEKLEKQVELLENNPAFDATYCNYKVIDENNNTRWEPSGLEELDRKDPLPQLLKKTYIMSPSSLMVTREAIMDIGMYDEQIRGTSDFDLYVRLALNHKFLTDQRSFCCRRSHEEQMSRDRAFMRQAEVVTLSKIIVWLRKYTRRQADNLGR